MRINKFVASATGMSRRSADQVITDGRVTIKGTVVRTGTQITTREAVQLDGKPLRLPNQTVTIMLNKPAGYVCSRNGQGSPTIYDLLPQKYRSLKPVGRLDKDSSGLLLLTDDGELSNRLTHPRYAKIKVYEIELNKPLLSDNQDKIEHGVQLEDGLSRLSLKPLDKTGKRWQVTMSEGRNRQIRRTFAALDCEVTGLHRIKFGDYELGGLETKTARPV